MEKKIWLIGLGQNKWIEWYFISSYLEFKKNSEVLRNS